MASKSSPAPHEVSPTSTGAQLETSPPPAYASPSTVTAEIEGTPSAPTSPPPVPGTVVSKEPDRENYPEVVPEVLPEVNKGAPGTDAPEVAAQNSSAATNENKEVSAPAPGTPEGTKRDTANAPAYNDADVEKNGYKPNAAGMTASAPAGGVHTVTPLHLLGDQSDRIDCPFCRTCVQSEVKHANTSLTYIYATVCCLTTIVGVIAPLYLHWGTDLEHRCPNCNHVVARKAHGKKEFETFGTPEHLREASKYHAAQPNGQA